MSRTVALLAILALAARAEADVPVAIPRLEAYVEALRERTGVPGVAIAVVQGDEVAYLQGFGVREVGRPEPIDPDTVFQLASVSKPLTATVLAGLVGDRLATWDTAIADLDPGFRLHGDYESAHVTLRDLLCHRSGLPDHAGDRLEDLGYSRAEVLRRLRFLEDGGPFRASYAYTNFGFTEAAVAASKAAGKGWEDVAADRLFRPLGMGRTSYRHADYAAEPNRARLHVRVGGDWVAKHDRQPDAQAPAGGASSSARDLARWLRLLLADGRFEGRPVVDAEALGEAFRPQVVSHRAETPTGRTGFYGLGWNVGRDDAGRLLLNHSGAFNLGAATCVAIVPEADLGIVVLTNAAPIGVPEAIAFHFLDLVRDGAPSRDWLATVAPSFEAMNRPPYGPLAVPEDPAPPLPLPSYAGTYRNPYVGDAVIAEEAGRLVLRLGPDGRAYPLAHLDRDTFTYQPPGESAAGLAAVSFRNGTDRRAESVTFQDLDLEAPGTLHRVPDAP